MGVQMNEFKTPRFVFSAFLLVALTAGFFFTDKLSLEVYGGLLALVLGGWGFKKGRDVAAKKDV